MNLALVGMGRMGRAVERLATPDHAIVARFDSAHPLEVSAGAEVFNGADIAVDFSRPDRVLDHIRLYCARGQSAVIGTTGWNEAEDDVREWVEDAGIGLLAAPNFSIGVALLREALRRVVPLLNALPEFDVYVQEAHHTGKLDSPSGTALMLAQTILDGLDRKTRIEPETVHGAITPEALHVTSTRVGSVFGRHTMGLDSPFDTLAFTHEAKTRDGFAYGALKAAEWLHTRTGFFTLDDLIQTWLS